MDPLSVLLSAILQVAVFSLIPFLTYLVTRRKVAGFMDYVGIKRAPAKSVAIGFLLSLVAVVSLLSESAREIISQEGFVGGEFAAEGVTAAVVCALLVKAWVNTGFSEEIFFRGFLAKRLIALMGFQKGNLLQAFLFGALHGTFVLILPEEQRSVGLFMVFFLMPSAMAWLTCYINERLAGGSIIPGWVLHSTSNTLAYGAALFWA